MSLKKDTLIPISFFLLFGFILVISAQTFIEPTSSPPEGNVYPPLNTGPELQIKEGPFGSLTLGGKGFVDVCADNDGRLVRCASSIYCAGSGPTSISIGYSYLNSENTSLFREDTLLITFPGSSGSGTYVDEGLSSDTFYTYYLRQGTSPTSPLLDQVTCKTSEPGFDFLLDVFPENIILSRGDTSTLTIRAELLIGPAEQLTFQIRGLPQGVSATSPPACTPTCSVEVDLLASETVEIGTYQLTVEASGGGVKKVKTVNLEIVPFQPFVYNQIAINADSPISIDMATEKVGYLTFKDSNSGRINLFKTVNGGESWGEVKGYTPRDFVFAPASDIFCSFYSSDSWSRPSSVSYCKYSRYLGNLNSLQLTRKSIYSYPYYPYPNVYLVSGLRSKSKSVRYSLDFSKFLPKIGYAQDAENLYFIFPNYSYDYNTQTYTQYLRFYKWGNPISEKVLDQVPYLSSLEYRKPYLFGKIEGFNNSVYIAYVKRDASNPEQGELKLAKSTDFGSSFQIKTLKTDVDPDYPIGLKVIDDNELVIVYARKNSNQPPYMVMLTSQDGGSTFKETLVRTFPVDFSAISVDALSIKRIWILYLTKDTKELILAKYSPQISPYPPYPKEDFQVQYLDNSAENLSPSLTQDPEGGNLYIIYQDYNPQNPNQLTLKLLESTNSGQSFTSTQLGGYYFPSASSVNSIFRNSLFSMITKEFNQKTLYISLREITSPIYSQIFTYSLPSLNPTRRNPIRVGLGRNANYLEPGERRESNFISLLRAGGRGAKVASQYNSGWGGPSSALYFYDPKPGGYKLITSCKYCYFILSNSSLATPDGETLYLAVYEMQEGDLWFFKSIDGGISWSSPVRIDKLFDVGYLASIGVWGNNIYIAYIDSTFSRLKLAKSTDGGNSWQIGVVDSRIDVRRPIEIKVVGPNEIIIAYGDMGAHGETYLTVARSSDGGRTFQYHTVLDTPLDFYGLDMEANSLNEIYIVFNEYDALVDKYKIGFARLVK